MLKHISTLQTVFAFVMVIVTYQANAQSFTVTNLTSDRYSQIAWDFTGWDGYDGGECNNIVEVRATASCDGASYDNETVNESTEYPTFTWNTVDLGPSFNENVKIEVEYECGIPGYIEGFELCVSGTYNLVTLALFDPTFVDASETSGFDEIEVKWGKGTDLEDSDSKYKIYRDGTLVHTAAGTARSWVDTGLSPNTTYSYRVATSTDLNGGSDSPGVTDPGSTASVTASDGDFSTRTTAEWTSMAAYAEAVRVFRNSVLDNTLEEIAILAKDATVYNDYDGVPGFNYTYGVQAIYSDGTTSTTISDDGFTKPNGSISGRVSSPLGTGVSGVDIEVSYTTSKPAGGPATSCTSDTYCTTTDSDGYYSINEIYYGTNASFTITPSKTGSVTHIYSPTSAARLLDQNDRAQEANFIDETVIDASGTIFYEGDSCKIPNVTVLVDGEDVGIVTDGMGAWEYALEEPGTYTFTPELFDHAFENSSNASSTTLSITTNTSGIDFEDVTVRSVEIIAQGGCAFILGDSVEVTISNTDGCTATFKKRIDNTGTIVINDISARDGYSFDVTRVVNPEITEANILDQFDPIELDLLEPGTYEKITSTTQTIVTPAITDVLPDGTIVIIADETTEIITTLDTTTSEVPYLRFIYRAPVGLAIDYGPDATIETCPSPLSDLVVLEQRVKYTLDIEVFEDQNGDRCPVDQGTLILYDEVSDNEANPLEVPVSNGHAFYDMIPGEVDPVGGGSRPYQKYLYISPEIDFLESQSETFWVLVEGFTTHEPTFITTTPELPQIILHDPPGDNSYAFVESGTSITTFGRSSFVSSEGEGESESTSIGFGSEFKGFGSSFGSDTEVTVTEGTSESGESGYFTTVTFNETFSTSSLENFTSGDGDVYVGLAINQSFAESIEISYDTCTVTSSDVVTVGLEGIETTFIYAESHIRNTLLPQFNAIRTGIDTSTETGKIQYNNALRDSLSWQSILDANSGQRENASQLLLNEGNISISAGATYSRSYSTEDGVNSTYQYDVYVDESTSEDLGGSVFIPIFSYANTMGEMVSSSYTQSEVSGDEETENRTIGYIIEDNDLGDFITFNVYRDSVYDTPIFETVAGTTSCPNEPGTQSRDMPAISIPDNVVNNVPAGGIAKFQCDISNLSESGEAREYAVRVVSSTNPDGALVRLAGQLINFSPASVFIAPLGKVEFQLTVEAGPVANEYEDILIMVYPPCEYALWQDGGTLLNADTFEITARFESLCSDVSIVDPPNNWLVNQAANETLVVTIGGYDINNEFLERIAIERQAKGGGFVEVASIDTANLESPFQAFSIDFSAVTDGSYAIRAVTYCTGGAGKSYSNIIEGILDRSSIAPFGTPSPSDGYLQPGQDIEVTFDTDINGAALSSANITLVRNDSMLPIGFVPQVSGNVLLLKPDDTLTSLPELQGVELTAYVNMVEDLNGNVQEYPVEWSFIVNSQPVFWDPDVLSLTALEGKSFTFSNTLKNNGTIARVYSFDEEQDPGIVSYPEWLTPLKSSGTILSNGVEELEFALQDGLQAGVYSGVVTTAVNGSAVSFNITIEILAKPVNWSFDPGQYQYSASYILQFSKEPNSSELSEDTRDLIAAFVDGEIRGIAQISYLEGPDLYRAFMTVYSNTSGGGGAEDVSFRFWTALDGREYSAIETSVFDADQQIGSIAAPFVLHPNGNFQVIPLRKGWNTISFSVESDDQSRENVFKSLLSASTTNEITIKSQDETAMWSSGSGWNGNLQDINVVEGYMVHLSDHGDTLRTNGEAVLLPTELDVSSGWNWIGFPSQIEKPVNSVLQDLSSANGDLLKSEDAFAQYFDDITGWLGTLTDFQPGKGYKLNTNTNGTITYRSLDEFDVIEEAWEFNMNITAALEDLHLIDFDPLSMTLGVFIGGECRGSIDATQLAATKDHRYLLLAYGSRNDKGQELEFRFLENGTGKILGTIHSGIEFIPDGIVGKVTDPVILQLDGKPNVEVQQDQIRLYPNPTSTVLNVTMDIQEDTQVTIDLLSIDGKLVDSVIKNVEHIAGSHTYQVDMQRHTSGMYIVRIETSKRVITERIMKN